MLRRNGLVVKSVESVLRLEGSLWWERFVKEVGLAVGEKERGSYGDRDKGASQHYVCKCGPLLQSSAVCLLVCLSQS